MVLTMDRWKGKVAVVTGASSGIGAAIVEQLVEYGLKVVGLARRKQKLDELKEKLAGKNGQFYGIATDITHESDIISAFQWTKDYLGPVHILVNNAGINRLTSLVDGDTKLWKEVLDTNLLGVCIANREAIRSMREHNVDGHIIMMNSIFGRKVIPIPYANLYPSSKHGITALTETLKQELISIDSKIKISSVSPGLVDTEMPQAAALGSGLDEIEESYGEYIKVAPILKPSDVADAVIYMLSTPPNVQILELILQPLGEKF